MEENLNFSADRVIFHGDGANKFGNATTFEDLHRISDSSGHERALSGHETSLRPDDEQTGTYEGE